MKEIISWIDRQVVSNIWSEWILWNWFSNSITLVWPSVFHSQINDRKSSTVCHTIFFMYTLKHLIGNTNPVLCVYFNHETEWKSRKRKREDEKAKKSKQKIKWEKERGREKERQRGTYVHWELLETVELYSLSFLLFPIWNSTYLTFDTWAECDEVAFRNQCVDFASLLHLISHFRYV